MCGIDTLLPTVPGGHRLTQLALLGLLLRLVLVAISIGGAFMGHNEICRAPVVLNRGSAPGSITVSRKVVDP